MNELFASGFAILMGAVLATALARRLPERERIWVWATYVAHFVAACAKVLIVFYYYGDGDLDSYIRFGARVADIIRASPGRWLVPYLEYGLHMDVHVPYYPPGQSAPTHTMFTVSALHQLLFGPTRFGICLFVSAFSAASKVGLYFVFREHLPAAYRPRLAWATMLVPSAVFWSSSLSKESVLWVSCGSILYGFHVAFFKQRPLRGGLIMVTAAAASALVKAYVLMPLVVGAAIWLYIRSERGRPRREFGALRTLIMTVVVFGLASLLVVGLGKMFPRYQVQNFTEQASYLQSRAGHAVQGSGYTVVTNDSLGGQLAAAPVAAATSMFRPFIFEARNPLMLAAALETTFFLLLTLYILRERGFGAVRVIRSSPALMFCLAYVVIFSVAVGLTSTNLGTLSRYRMPMMPYFGVLYAVLTPMAAPRAQLTRVRRRRRTSATVVPLHAG